jgi:Tfp pilus assembly protein PilE
MPPVTSGKAIASLVLGLFFFFLPTSILAIIFGHLSLSEIKKSAGRLKGEAIAIAGLVLGYLGIVSIPVILILAAIAIPSFMRARIAANEAAALAFVTRVNMAETGYADSRPDHSYSCRLGELATGLNEPGISPDALSFQKNGYTFVLEGCSGRDATGPHYQVAAAPIAVHTSGVRMFCSDDSGVIRSDAATSSVGQCLENGTPMQ